jgi:hypothetical protein
MASAPMPSIPMPWPKSLPPRGARRITPSSFIWPTPKQLRRLGPRHPPKEAIALARAFWPGPLTLILKKEEGVPDIVTGGQDTVGLRVPNHPVALELLRAFGQRRGCTLGQPLRAHQPHHRRARAAGAG